MERQFKRNKLLNVVLMALSIILIIMPLVLGSVVDVRAAGNSSSSEANKQLTLKVYNNSDCYGKTYATSGGGYTAYQSLFTGKASDGYDVNEAEFKKLTSKAQSEFVSDLATAMTQAKSDDEASQNPVGITDDTLNDWWSRLQQKDGMGSKLLGTILENTKPDFVTANKIYQPFSGIVGTAMGLGAILIMALLGIVIVCDIAYITLPPVRLFVADEKEKGSGIGKASSKIISHDAIYAVTTVEEQSSNDGAPKQALGIYFKRRVIMLIILGICLLYLVSGQIYTFVGYILDMLSGFVS